MVKLIVNADDFGYSRGINYGIIEAYRNGIVTSTTLMVNMTGTIHAVELMKCHEGLAVGLHLNISLGEPLTQGKTLADSQGLFMKPDSLPKGYKYDMQELRSELREQYNKFMNLTGKKPSHLDSHLFSSDTVPQMRELVVELAKEEDIPLRNYSMQQFEFVKFINYRNYNAKPTLEYILENFEDIISNNYAEIMTHPGYIDNEILKNSSYNMQRIDEIEFLTSKKVLEIIKKNNVELINYYNVRK